MKETLQEFIKALNEDRFKDAHEIMEHQWKEYKKLNHPITKLLKGFINGATAFELIKRDNIDGASRLWATYEKYLPLMSDDIEEYELFFEANNILQTLKKDRLLHLI